MKTCKTKKSFGEENLDDLVRSFLEYNTGVPWERGSHDCVMFIHKFTEEVYGLPYADPNDYPFHNYRTARKALKYICKDHGVDTFEEVLDQCYHRVMLPVQGGLVAKEDNEGLTGYTYGVTFDGAGFFVFPDGLKALELNPTKDIYWSVL